MNKLAGVVLFTSLALTAGVSELGCKSAAGGGPSPPPGVTLGSLAVTSRSFPSNGNIPVDYSCDGTDKSPQLTWSSPPGGTRALAVLMEDPDASSGTFTHWILFNVPNEQLVLVEGVDPATINARVGVNDFHNLRYNGPCPPPHEQHRYIFRVFALDAPLNAPDGADRDAVYAAMTNHVLAEGYLVGTFSH